MNRARFRYNVSIAIAGAIAFLGALPVATSGFVRTGPQPFYAYLLLLLLLIPLGVAVWGWRAGTDADADGLRVRPRFRSHRIAWSEVSALVPRGRRVVAGLTDGRGVPLPAVTPADLPRLVAASGQELDSDTPADREGGAGAADDEPPSTGRHAAGQDVGKPPAAEDVQEAQAQQ